MNFPLWRLGVNPHLGQLSLGRNPWSCECRFLADFQQWLAAHPQQLADPDVIHCLLPDSQLIGLDEFNRSCSVDPLTNVVTRFQHGASVLDYIPLMAAGLCFLLLAAVVLAVLVVYRQSVRIWIFSRYRIRLCDSKGQLDDEIGSSSTVSRKPESMFDAFVSYSLKDEQFVSQVLAAELEHSATDGCAFRLCLQHRDFPSSSASGGNNPTGDPLALGLATSRRIVLVVSQSFIESEWTRPEVRTALTGFLRKPRVQIVAVMLTPWTDDQSDPELSLLLRSAVLIKWGERNFWPKLRYYLPDPTPRHYIRNLQGGLWYQTGSTHHHHDHQQTAKRNLPHPLPADADLMVKNKSELYWEVNGNPASALPRRYTSTPHGAYTRSDQAHHHQDDSSVYSGQCYSRLEHSYMSIDHGHEHIYSSVQDPAEVHQQHVHHHHHHQHHQHPQECWSYRYPDQHSSHLHQQQQQQHPGPRPPVQQPPPGDFLMFQQQGQQHSSSTFLV